MKSWIKRYLLAVVVLLLLWTCGCASWAQLPPPSEPGSSYRGLNESTIIPGR
jgi:hypothetical protein